MDQSTPSVEDAIREAIAKLNGSLPHAPEVIQFNVRHALLLIGKPAPVYELARSLRHQFDVVAIIDGPKPESRLLGVNVVSSPKLELEGYLGRFTVKAWGIHGQLLDPGVKSSNEDGYFDLVLDISEIPVLDRPVPPLGYLRPKERNKQDSITHDIPKLVRGFEKPVYINLESIRCVHSRQQVNGCDRCIRACPANAITSGKQAIAFEPHLCQGCGSCTAICPTGALSFTAPPLTAISDRIHELLKACASITGTKSDIRPWIVLQEGEPDLEHYTYDKDIALLPVPVGSIGITGLEALLAPFALGAVGVIVKITNDVPYMVRETLMAQVKLASSIMQQMGYDDPPIGVISSTDDLLSFITSSPQNHNLLRGSWIYPQDKDPHKRLLAIFDRLSSLSVTKTLNKAIDLPEWAMFGGIEIDREACTMCLACTSLCPSSALQANANGSQLEFTEPLCVQCGICVRGCPENALKAHARFNYEALSETKHTVLNHVALAKCKICGQPFLPETLLKAALKQLDSSSEETRRAKEMLQVCVQCRSKSVMHAQFPIIKSGREKL